MTTYSRLVAIASVIAGLMLFSARVSGQVVEFRDPQNDSADEPAVQLKLRGNVDLRAFVDYVGQRLNLSFIYDDEIAAKRINVRAPDEVPVRSLLELLGSVLKMEGLILVDADTPGWLRIIDKSEMPRHIQSERPSDANPATPVTHMFTLENADPQSVLPLIRDFLTDAGGTVVAVSETGTLIVTDYSSVIDNLATIIRMLDQGRGTTLVKYYRVQHASVSELVRNVGEALNSRNVKLVGVEETQVVALVGTQPFLDRAIEFIEELDVPVERSVKVYRFENVRAERVEAILEGMLEGEQWARFTITADKDANLLVIRGTPDVHKIFAEIIAELDQPTDSPATPLKFYKLQNAKAIEVFFTLQALQQMSPQAYGGNLLGAMGAASGYSQRAMGNLANFAGSYSGNGASGVRGGVGANNFSNSFRNPDQGNSPTPSFENTELPLGTPERDGFRPSQDRMNQLSSAALSQLSVSAGSASLPGGAQVSVDIASNSLIVVAPNEVHNMYEQIIKKLDVRRPQVLVEAHIIAVDTSDRFQLGVEVSGGDRIGSRRLFKFTSFGLSEVDAATGQLTLNPGLGFNGALVDPDIADVILQALVTHSRARVLSSPQLLVNDNSVGQLTSTASVPFQSVNASNTVSTTSLGGNQDAGTVLSVRPQINEGEYLQLEFELEFSTFAGESADVSLPPPRQIDKIRSQVTIPNGHTVIVGGLNRAGQQDSATGVPWLERIPVIRDLTSLRTEQDDTTSFFLFLRPNILRDERFRDLKHFSQRSIHQSGGKGDYPSSRPVMMK